MKKKVHFAGWSSDRVWRSVRPSNRTWQMFHRMINLQFKFQKFAATQQMQLYDWKIFSLQLRRGINLNIITGISLIAAKCFGIEINFVSFIPPVFLRFIVFLYCSFPCTRFTLSTQLIEPNYLLNLWIRHTAFLFSLTRISYCCFCLCSYGFTQCIFCYSHCIMSG